MRFDVKPHQCLDPHAVSSRKLTSSASTVMALCTVWPRIAPACVSSQSLWCRLEMGYCEHPIAGAASLLLMFTKK